MTKTLAFMLLATLAGCTGVAEVRYSGDSSQPELVAIDEDPGVQVVANADEPTFYANHTYWLYRDQSWYRSSSHVSGWTRAGDPPISVTRIERPEHYVHYRHGAGGRPTTMNQQQPAPAQPVIRDHRESPAAPMPAEQMQRPMPGREPGREPGPRGEAPPAANPLPPAQVPPGGRDDDRTRDHRSGTP